MTIGQRIAQLRKEKGLSQEELGATMGVSRQAISKWEADAAIPEIEKLIALSRLFSIPVGQLLGVEEPAGQPDTEAPGPDPAQAADLAEEVLRRYLQAQPRPQRRKKWPWVLGAAAILLALCCAVQTVADLRGQISTLQRTVFDVKSSQISMDNQIGSITDRVQEALNSQASLLVNYDITLEGVDIPENTATLALTVTPKSLAEGTVLEFVVSDTEDAWRAPCQPLPDSPSFAARLTVPLRDGLHCYAAFQSEQGVETEEMYPNGQFSLLATDSSLSMYVQIGGMLRADDSALYLEELPIYVQIYPAYLVPDSSLVYAEQARLCFYQGDTLLEALPMEPSGTAPWGGVTRTVQFDLYLEQYTLSLDPEKGGSVRAVAEVTDNFGRVSSSTLEFDELQ